MPFFATLKHSAGAKTQTWTDQAGNVIDTATVDVFESEFKPQFNHVVLNGVPQITSSDWDEFEDAAAYEAAKNIA